MIFLENFWNNITSGSPIVYIILAIVVISAILGYNSAMGDIRKELFWRKKK